MRACPDCGADVYGDALNCDNCGRALHIEGRDVAVMMDVAGVVPVVVCPECSTKFPRKDGVCPECQTRVCMQCGMVLARDESHCPRCGAEGPPIPTFPCPVCKTDLEVGSGECESCGATLCPECGGVVDEDAAECFRCGAKIGLYCPNCGVEVADEDEVCAACGLVFEDA